MRPADPAAGATFSAAVRPSSGDIGEAEEIHIAGVLVQCRPLDLMRVMRAVNAI
jgi:nitrate reductase NapD